MANPESIYKKVTGLDPKRDLQPPLSGSQLERSLHTIFQQLEKTYESLTGFHPKTLSPPLTGIPLAKEVTRLRGNQTTPDDSLIPAQLVNVSVFETGRCGGKSPEGDSFTVLKAMYSNGRIVGTYLFRGPPEPEDLMDFANQIPPEEWFDFDPERPAESGI